MNETLLENITITLLKALGELTPDTKINNAITAMSVASVRIRRLQSELDELRWHSIEEEGLPPVGQWYDVYPYILEGEKTVRERYLLDEATGARWYTSGAWNHPVTHWRQRPAGPEGEE